MILLRVPGTLEFRNLALRAASEVCRIVQLDEWDGASLEAETVSALGEAFNNVAIHGYGGHEPGDIDIEISWSRDAIVMKVTDTGVCFEPDQIKPPDLDALPEGGMGLFIIRSFMDEVAYTPGPPNVLRMVKHRFGRSKVEVTPLPPRPHSSSQGPPAKGQASGRTGFLGHLPELGAKFFKRTERTTRTSESGWRLKAVDMGAAISQRKMGSAGPK